MREEREAVSVCEEREAVSVCEEREAVVCARSARLHSN